MAKGKGKAPAQIDEDVLLSENDVQSALSLTYVQAIAAGAGYTCGEPPGPDRDSIDIQIAAGGNMRPKLDLQLKASIRLAGDADAFSYPLKMKNYNDLRVETQTPRLLVVLDLPPKQNTWLKVSIKQLVMKRAAYWLSLRNLPESTNKKSVSVLIPRANVFDVAALTTLLEKSRTGLIT